MIIEILIYSWLISGILFWIKTVYDEWSSSVDITLDLILFGFILFALTGPWLWIAWLLFHDHDWPVVIKGKKK